MSAVVFIDRLKPADSKRDALIGLPARVRRID
jgi:hypothetical protein